MATVVRDSTLSATGSGVVIAGARWAWQMSDLGESGFVYGHNPDAPKPERFTAEHARAQGWEIVAEEGDSFVAAKVFTGREQDAWPSRELTKPAGMRPGDLMIFGRKPMDDVAFGCFATANTSGKTGGDGGGE